MGYRFKRALGNSAFGTLRFFLFPGCATACKYLLERQIYRKRIGMKAFVDESGDPGVGRGSRWLVFGLVMLSDSEVSVAESFLERQLRAHYQGQRNYFHFRKLDHHKKLEIIDQFLEIPWIGCLLARDTRDVHSSPWGVSLYENMAGYLMERVSRRAERLQEPATIYFEESRHLTRKKLPKFRDFIKAMIQRGSFLVDPSWAPTNNIHVAEKGENPILSIADGLSHAGFQALEPDRHSKRTERSYYSLFLKRLWGQNPLHEVNVYDHGLLMRPKRRWPEFIQEHPWLILS